MNEVSFASKVWGSDDAVGTTGTEDLAGMEDAADFQQFLHAGPEHPQTASPTMGNMLDEVTRSLRETSEDLEKHLKRAGKSADPVEMLQVSKHLSETFLSNALATKVIGKATQALENLSRLQ